MKRILAGPHAVKEALHASPKAIEVICVAESMRPSSVRNIEDQARHARVALEFLSKESLDKLAGQLTHQGVIAITGAYPYQDLDRLLAHADKDPSPLILALDQVQDPQNLGAIMRSAYALGATGIIMPKDRSAPVNAVTVRASSGASELMRTVRVTNLVRTLDQLKDRNFQVFGAAPEATTRLGELSWKGSRVLVLGNEARGLRRLTKEHCDQLFQIPLANDFDSLNVSAAAAIALYEAAGQRF